MSFHSLPGFEQICRTGRYNGHPVAIHIEYVGGPTVDKVADVGPALRAAVKAQGEGKTTVLEMMVTRELGDPFRRDALSLPVRHLEKYRSTAAKR